LGLRAVCSDSATTPPDGYTEIFPIEALIFLDPVPPAFLLEQSRLFFRIGLEPLEPGVAGEWDEKDGYEEEFLAAAERGSRTVSGYGALWLRHSGAGREDGGLNAVRDSFRQVGCRALLRD